MTDKITCDMNDCERESDFLLDGGERCLEHAHEQTPDITVFLMWGNKAMNNKEEREINK